GLGDRLVGGAEDGHTYSVDRATGALVDCVTAGPLMPADLSALTELGRRAEQVQGRPQDIEWAIEGDDVYLLQARPMTTPLRPAPIPDTTLTVFDNSNIIESYPGLVSPL